MRRAASTSLIALVGLAVFSSLAVSGPGAAPQAPSPVFGDFPALDEAAEKLLRRGLLAKAAKAAIEEAPFDPASIVLALEDTQAGARTFRRAGIVLAALNHLAAGEAVDVERAAALLAESYRYIRRSDTPRQEDLANLVATIRARLPELPREQGARTARALILVESSLLPPRDPRAGQRPRPGTLELIREYAGTEEALLAQVRVLSRTRDVDDEIARLDAFARRHSGTTPGAAAMYAMAQTIGGDDRGRYETPPRTDPTDRFLQVLAIVEDLESGLWPASEFVDGAHMLVVGFRIADRNKFEPSNVERVLEAYQAFLLEHAQLLDQGAETNQNLWRNATSRLGQLHERLGDPVGGIEAAFDLLEPVVDNPDALRLLAAEYYIREATSTSSPDSAGLIQKALSTLAPLLGSNLQPHARRARATVAGLHFHMHEYEAAIDAYRTFLSRWPDSDWAWVATLRIGQAQEALGDQEGALSTYATVASHDRHPAPGIVLAHALAARANEALGRLDAALGRYVAAAEAWDDDYGPTYTLHTYTPWPANEDLSLPYAPPAFANRDEMARRIDELTDSVQVPEGELFERGRSLVKEQRWQEARGVFEVVLERYPASPLSREAGELGHQARLSSILDIGTVEPEQPDMPAILAELEALSAEPWDPAVGAAKLAIAALLGKAGYASTARARTREALQEWLAHQRNYFAPRHAESENQRAIRADVAAIRDLVFQPLGGNLYENERAFWKADDFPARAPAFFTTNPDILVSLAGGRNTSVRVSEPPPELDNVVLMTQESHNYLYPIFRRLGGRTGFSPNAADTPWMPLPAMDVPGETAGDPVEIRELWGEFLDIRQRGLGLHFVNYPQVTGIEFEDAERTRAAAEVTIGYAGCRVIVEKQAGRWTVVRVTRFWVS